MPRWINILLQISTLLTGAGNNFTQIVPDQYKSTVNVMLMMFSGIVAIIAHNYNPDGTKASTAPLPTTVVVAPEDTKTVVVHEPVTSVEVKK